MTKGKVVIVVLILLGVLFAFGLGANLMPKEGEPEGGKNADEEQQKKSVEGYDKNGWIGSMDKLMGRFSPRLDASRLQRSNDGVECKRKDNVLTFNSNTGCAIKIRSRLPGCDDDYESTTLKLAEGGAATRAAAARMKMNPALMQAQQRSRLKPQLAVITPKLVVKYRPGGESGYKSVEERRGEFRLVVLEKGGDLKLSCTGCGNNQPVEVSLETRNSCD